MINWKLRLKNKVTLMAIISGIISIVYSILNLIGVIPKFDAKEIVDIVSIILDILCLLGIINDPTTVGLGDSERALTYKAPNNDHISESLYPDDVSKFIEEEQ